MFKYLRNCSVLGLLVAVAFFISACSVMQAKRNAETDSLLMKGKYAAAAALAEQRMGLTANKGGALLPIEYKQGHVLDHLEAAEAWRLVGNTQRSIEQYDAAEQSLKGVETKNAVVATLGQTGAVLVNDSVLDYTPSPAEAVLINYYKAIDFWTEHDADNTRVELNRAEDRIRIAVDRYAAEIAKAKEESEKQAGLGVSYDKFGEQIKKGYPELSQWRPYRNFVFPPATYLHALFLSRLGTGSDLDKAHALFERVSGIVGSHPAINRDLRQSAKGRDCPQNNCVWVLVENGMGPVLTERRLDIPVPIKGKPVVVSVALPALQSRSLDADSHMVISYRGKHYPPVIFADMDRVIETDFERRFPAIFVRSLLSAAMKAVAQTKTNSKTNPIGGLLGNILSVALTSADTRCWRSIPGHFALARFTRQNTNKLQLRLPSGEVDVHLPARGSAVVYVRVPVDRNAPVVRVLGLSQKTT